MSLTRGKGYRFLIVKLFKPRKSTHIRHPPSFFLTTTIGNAHSLSLFEITPLFSRLVICSSILFKHLEKIEEPITQPITLESNSDTPKDHNYFDDPNKDMSLADKIREDQKHYKENE